MQPETVTRVPYSVENARVLYEALRQLSDRQSQPEQPAVRAPFTFCG